MCGYVGSYLLRRQNGEEVEFVTVLLWDSLEALRDFGGQVTSGQSFRENIAGSCHITTRARHTTKCSCTLYVTTHERARRQETKVWPQNRRREDVTMLDHFQDSAIVGIVATDCVYCRPMPKFDGDGESSTYSGC